MQLALTLTPANLPGGELYPFQVEAVDFIAAHHGRALVADQPGLGKTVTSIGYLQRRPDLKPILIVAPAIVKIQWARHLSAWLAIPEDEIQILATRKASEISGDYALINYDILQAWAKQIFAWKPQIVIFDECHRLKSSDSQRSKIAKQISALPSVKSVIGLTGTPLLNRPLEIYHPISCINPHIFPNWYRFAMRFCDPQQTEHVKRGSKRDEYGEPVGEKSWDFSGASHLDELHKILTDRVMIRRTKDILPGLPEYQSITIPLECDLARYHLVRKDVQERLRSIRDQIRQSREKIANLPEPEMLAALAARAEANSTIKLYGLAITEIVKLRKEAALAKVPHIVDWVKDFLESGEALVIFAHHHECTDALYAALTKAGVNLPKPLDGRMTQRMRQQVAAEFADGQHDMLLCGIQAMGEGIDGMQQRASYLAFCEFGWNPAIHDQASSRLHRNGQKNAVTGYYMLAVDTLDERMAHLIDSKASVVSAAVGEVDSKGILESLIDWVVDEG